MLTVEKYEYVVVAKFKRRFGCSIDLFKMTGNEIRTTVVKIWLRYSQSVVGNEIVRKLAEKLFEMISSDR